MKSLIFYRNRISTTTDYLLQSLIPEPCLHCRKQYPASGILCSTCYRLLPEQITPLTVPATYYKTQYVFSYGGVIKSLFQAAKFSGKRRASSMLCALAKPVLSSLVETGAILLPMPSQRKLLSALLNSAVPVRQIVPGIFTITKQGRRDANKQLSEAARFRRIRENLQLSNKPLPQAERYILCDDVLTTGATLGHAAWLLEKSGIAKEKILLWALCYRERVFGAAPDAV